MKRVLVAFIVSILVSHNASAGVTQIGKITELWVNDNGTSNKAFISVGQYYTSPCRNLGESRYFIMDLSQPGMSEAYAMALSAYMADLTIQMGSTGACIGIYEGLKYINLIRNR